MAGDLLLDTGALVAILDRSQSIHARFRDFYDGWEGTVVSTEAVLTEATHLLGRVRGGREACIDFFLAGGALLVPSTPSSLQRCRRLLDRYADLPMDFADATLVVLAEELGTDLVLTTDRRDFGVYRIGSRRSFRIKPDARPATTLRERKR
jgi:predicted nucleic acid-binding protein